ncbi:MAG: sulfatase [Candidatus Solibacter sp.]|jgi:arylsulfatase A-like enzyme
MNSRRQFISRAAALGSAALAAQSSRAAAVRPNIVYLHSHDSGRYLQPYGHAVPTPNIQKLASQGILFRQAFSAAPTCSPSRASLLTGQCPHSNGMLGLAHRGFSMTDYSRHMLHTLGKAGYHSVLAGLQHIASVPETIGFDELLRPRNTTAAVVAPLAVEFLNRRPSQPFFLDAGFFETHREYPEPTADDDPRYLQPPVPIPDTPQTRRDMAGFRASARLLDRGAGMVLEALERNGLAANTLVISTTDHGIAFPRMKCNLTDSGLGVSLILRGPGPFSGGKVSDAMVSHLDIFPTLCDWLEIERPAWLEGRSVLPLLRGEEKELNDEVFAEVNYHASYEPVRAVRTQRFKYIRRYDGRTTAVLPNCDDSPSKDLWLEYGWRGRAVPQEELYDLIFDPAEQNNLRADPNSAPVLREMRGRLERWMTRTNDPLLKGPVPAPPGAKVNPVDGVSPKEPVVDAGRQL